MRSRAFLLLALATAALAPALGASAPAPKAAASVLPWIDDDYARALSEAKRKKIPIFAELWAPWCHTCRSMQAFVFTDKALSRNAKEFIWLSIDTEKAQNAPFVKKYPLRAWPSFYVIDPSTETVALRWVGGATVAQLRKFFHDGSRAAGGARDAALGKADALYAEGEYEKAAAAYAEALAKLPPGSPGYTRAVEARLYSLSDHAQPTPSAWRLRGPRCRRWRIGVGRDLSRARAWTAPRAAADRARAGRDDRLLREREVRAVLADPSLKLAADDRSALYGSLQSALDEGGDKAGAQKVADEWVAYLDGEAARAKTATQLTALDPNRLNAFQAAGQPEKAIPMLEASEKAFPEDYNPPARLALVYLWLKQYDTALAASDRALARVYGPRKLRVLAVRADIYKGMGNAAAARKTVEESLEYAEALPAGSVRRRPSRR